MDALLKRQKNLKFFMSATGDRSGYQYLTDKFDVFMLDIPSPYTWKGWAHQSEVHPVADLFALACCPVILATPVSGFSHWAANVLGKPSMSLIPLKGATNNMPATGMLSLYGRRINTWRAACRGELQEAVKIFSFDDPIQCTSAVTEWLEADTHRF
jgi:hypothetical protein